MDELVGGVFFLALAVLALCVCIVWIVFPFTVNNHFKRLTKLQEEANEKLKFIANRLAPVELPPLPSTKRDVEKQGAPKQDTKDIYNLD